MKKKIKFKLKGPTTCVHRTVQFKQNGKKNKNKKTTATKKKTLQSEKFSTYEIQSNLYFTKSFKMQNTNQYSKTLNERKNSRTLNQNLICFVLFFSPK